MSDRLTVFHDDKVLEHDTGSGMFEGPASPFLTIAEQHPENADRVRNMIAVLRNGPIKDQLDWRGAEAATSEQMTLFHDSAYIADLASRSPVAVHRDTGTTVFGPGSWRVIQVACGLAIAAADHVWSGESKLAYALCRPPGHHAQPAETDGYCFINNAGVAIQTLRQKGLKRACIIDWDVHHGNGTQEGFYDDPNVLTVSLHMDHGAWGPTHRQTGSADEVGKGDGIGANLNVPLPYGSGDTVYTRAFDEIVTPAVLDFGPEVLFVAAGQDANQFDPNGRQTVTMEGFRQLGLRARALANELTDGKLVLIQEGGYALSYAPYCLHATLEGVLRSDKKLEDPIAYMPEHLGELERTLDRLKSIRRNALR